MRGVKNNKQDNSENEYLHIAYSCDL